MPDRIGQRSACGAPHEPGERRRQHAPDRNVQGDVESQRGIDGPHGALAWPQPPFDGGKHEDDRRVLPHIGDRRPPGHRHVMPGEHDRFGHDEYEQQACDSHARTRLIRFNNAIDTRRLAPRLRQIQSCTTTAGAGGRA